MSVRGDRELRGFTTKPRFYAGDGMLSRHRLKAYGFLDCRSGGRSKTLGESSGSYSEARLDRMATELDEARLERYGMHPRRPTRQISGRFCQHRRSARQPNCVRHRPPGFVLSRGSLPPHLPKNSPELVEQTLQASARRVTRSFHLKKRGAGTSICATVSSTRRASLRTLLEFGWISRQPGGALHLFSLTHNERLRRIIDAWAEIMGTMGSARSAAEAGYNRAPLISDSGDAEHIAVWVAPERWRLYSISSVSVR